MAAIDCNIKCSDYVMQAIHILNQSKYGLDCIPVQYCTMSKWYTKMLGCEDPLVPVEPVVYGKKIIQFLDHICQLEETIILDYGAYYNWWAYTDPRFAPEGWHLPSLLEFQTLMYGNGWSWGTEGIALKEAGALHWLENNTGTNSSGFTGIGGSYRIKSDNPEANGSFSGTRTLAVYPTSDTQEDGGETRVSCLALGSSYPGVSIVGAMFEYGEPVKLIKDSSDWYEGETVQDYDGYIYNTVKIGDQVWTVEPLLTKHFNDGELIPTVQGNTAWGELSTPGKCYRTA